jgi:hypothetical protein
MKTRALVLLAMGLFLATGVRAYDILLNTDFNDGTSHWKDDPNATQCLIAKGNPDGSGIVIPMDPAKWFSIQQTFDSPDETLVLNVTYTIPDNASFDASRYRLPMPTSQTSTLPNGITIVSEPLGRRDNFNPTVIAAITGVAVKDFSEHLQPNQWAAIISDPIARTVHYAIISSGAANPKTVSIELKGLMEHEEKTLFLAFPPGTGSVTITHASLDQKQSSSSGSPDDDPIILK